MTAKIAKLSEEEGVCIEGRWAGWLFRRHPDGGWISVRKLEIEDPYEGLLPKLIREAIQGDRA